MLINGQWAKDFHTRHETGEEGEFIRADSQLRSWITLDGAPGPSGEGGFAAEVGRYHLYVAFICPWASRTLMARKLKGLEEVVSVSILDPRVTPKVWRFGGGEGDLPGSMADPLYGAEYLYEIYLRGVPDYTGQVTVPVLWDKQRQTIVNNESSEIIRMLNSGFGELADNTVDLYPEALRTEIDAVNEHLYTPFNNGVYRAGFAAGQGAYEKAVAEVFGSLDYIEQRLQGQEYLVGNRLTEADVRAFVTLVRFEAAYYGLFKTNLRHLRDYPAVCAYIDRIYALPGIAETVNIEHIKAGYYSLAELNPSGIVPAGPQGFY